LAVEIGECQIGHVLVSLFVRVRTPGRSLARFSFMAPAAVGASERGWVGRAAPAFGCSLRFPIEFGRALLSHEYTMRKGAAGISRENIQAGEAGRGGRVFVPMQPKTWFVRPTSSAAVTGKWGGRTIRHGRASQGDSSYARTAERVCQVRIGNTGTHGRPRARCARACRSRFSGP